MATIDIKVQIQNARHIEQLHKNLNDVAISAEKTAVAEGTLNRSTKQLINTMKTTAAAGKITAGVLRNLVRAANDQQKAIKQLKLDYATLGSQMKKTNVALAKQSILMKAAGGATRGFSGALGKLWLSYGQIAPMIAAFSATMLTLKTLKVGTEFDFTTRYIDALSDSAVQGEGNIRHIKDALLDMKGVAQTPNELALGLKEFAKAGVDVDEALRPLKNSLDGALGEMSRFATVAEMELGRSLEIVIGQANAFIEVDFVGAANRIAKAALSSSTSVEQMAEGLKHTTELGTVAGYSLTEVATAMALVAQKGNRGSQAGTSIRTSLLKLLVPSQKAAEMMDRLGVNFTAMAKDGSIKSLKQQLLELSAATAHLGEFDFSVLTKELAGFRAEKALGGLIDTLRKTPGAFQEMFDAIEQADKGVTFLSEKFGLLEKSAKVAFDQLKADFERTLIGAYDQETVVEAIHELRKVVTDPSFQAGLSDMAGAFMTAALWAAKLLAHVGKINGMKKTNIALIDYELENKKLDKLYEKLEKIQQRPIQEIEIEGTPRQGYTSEAGKDKAIAAVTAEIEKQTFALQGLGDEANKLNYEQAGIEEGTGKVTEGFIKMQAASSGAYSSFDSFDGKQSQGLETAKQHLNEVNNAFARMDEAAGKSEVWKVQQKINDELENYRMELLAAGEIEALQLVNGKEGTAIQKAKATLTRKYAKELSNAAKADAELTDVEKAAIKLAEQRLKSMEKLTKEMAKYIEETDKLALSERKMEAAFDFTQYLSGLDQYSKKLATLQKTALAETIGRGFGTDEDVLDIKAKLPDNLKNDLSLIAEKLGPAAKKEFDEIYQSLVKMGIASKEIQKAWTETALEGNSFFAGFAAGAYKATTEVKTLGQVGADVATSLATAWEGTIAAMGSGLWESIKNAHEKGKELQADIEQSSKDLAEQLRDMGRSGMSDFDAWKDLKAQADEYKVAATNAAAAGDFATAQEYAEKARDTYSQLNTEVKDGETVLVSQQDALSTAMDGVSESGRLAIEYMEQQKEEATGMKGIFLDAFGAVGDIWETTLSDMLTSFTNWVADLMILWAGNGLIDMLNSTFDLGMPSIGGAGGGAGGNAGTAVGVAKTGYEMYTGEDMFAGVKDYLKGAFTDLFTGAELSPAYEAAGAQFGAALGTEAFSALGTAGAYEVAASQFGAALGTEAFSTLGSGTAYTALAEQFGQEISSSILANTTQFSGFAEGGIQGAASTAVSGSSAAETGVAGLSAGQIGLGVFGAFQAGILQLDAISHRSAPDKETIRTGKGDNIISGVVDLNQDSIIEMEDMRHEIDMTNQHVTSFAKTMLYAGERSSESGAEIMQAGQASELWSSSVNRMGMDLETMAYAFGDKTAQMALALDGSATTTDMFIDALAGYNVSIEKSSEINNLGAQAALGSSEATNELYNEFLILTNSEEQAQVATQGLIVAQNDSMDAAIAAALPLAKLAAEAAALGTSAQITGPQMFAFRRALKDSGAEAEVAAKIQQLLSAAMQGVEGASGKLNIELIKLTGSQIGAQQIMGELSVETSLVNGAFTGLSSATTSAKQSVEAMQTAVETLSKTPLDIKVNVSGGGWWEAGGGGEVVGVTPHASGGIFTSPTLLNSTSGRVHQVAEAGRAEAILPLDSPNQISLMDAKLDAIMNGQRPLNVYVGGTKVQQIILPMIDKATTAKSRRGAMDERTAY